MRGPTYTEEEMGALKKLAKESGTLKDRAQAFLDEFKSDRSLDAIVQKLRKLGEAPARAPKRAAKRAVAKSGARRSAATVNGSAQGQARFEFEDGLVISGPSKRVAALVAQL